MSFSPLIWCFHIFPHFRSQRTFWSCKKETKFPTDKKRQVPELSWKYLWIYKWVVRIFTRAWSVNSKTIKQSRYDCVFWVTQWCLTLCNPIDCSPPGSSSHGFLQARILEWVAIPFSRGSSQPRDRASVSCIAGEFFTVWATREALYDSRGFQKAPKSTT